MFNPVTPLRRALLAVATIGLAACGTESDSIGLGSDEPATTTLNGVNLVAMTPGRTLAPASGDFTMVHPKNGASIQTGDASLTVLPGSVPNGTKITMTPLNNGYVEFQFGPSGLQFSSPAVLTISAAKANISGLDKAQLKIAGASDSGDDWQVIGGTYDPVSDTVTVEIHHFSRYALCIE